MSCRTEKDFVLISFNGRLTHAVDEIFKLHICKPDRKCRDRNRQLALPRRQIEVAITNNDSLCFDGPLMTDNCKHLCEQRGKRRIHYHEEMSPIFTGERCFQFDPIDHGCSLRRSLWEWLIKA